MRYDIFRKKLENFDLFAILWKVDFNFLPLTQSGMYEVLLFCVLITFVSLASCEEGELFRQTLCSVFCFLC